jgi:hypothetical protein
MKKNPKDPKTFEHKKKNQYNDAQSRMEKTKRKRKSPSPTLGGTINHFGKKFQRQKVKKQALMILSLEIIGFN